MFLSIKEIIKEKNRFLLIISMVILISYLVFFLTGLATGLASANRTAVDRLDAKEIILKKNANSNILASSIDASIIDKFDQNTAEPINVSQSVAYKNGDKSDETTIDVILIGINYGSSISPELSKGRMPENANEVLASENMVKEENISIGDYLILSENNRKFKIVGLSKSAKLFVSPVIYTELDMASSEMMMISEDPDVDSISSPTPNMPDNISAIVLKEGSDVNLGEDYVNLTIPEFINAIPGYLAQVLTFGLMIGFLIVIAAVILGIFMYIITLQKKQIYGIMKIQGISNSYIIKSVIFQTFFMSTVGVLIGLILTILTGIFLPAGVPFQSTLIGYAGISALIIAVSVLGAVFSARKVASIDPLEALE